MALRIRPDMLGLEDIAAIDRSSASAFRLSLDDPETVRAEQIALASVNPAVELEILGMAKNFRETGEDPGTAAINASVFLFGLLRKTVLARRLEQQFEAPAYAAGSDLPIEAME